MGFATITPVAKATYLFFDTFTALSPALNSIPPGWSLANAATGGSVDVIGTCNSTTLNDVIPGHTCYIDLDGTVPSANPPMAPGVLTKTVSLEAGYEYKLEFELAGNQNIWWQDNVYVNFGTAFVEIEIQSFTQPFKLYNLFFTPPASGDYALSFENSNDDEYGALLDNVRVSQVPGPLPILGVSMAFAYSRRLRARIPSSRH